jgi:predicted metal-dependent hydrolase
MHGQPREQLPRPDPNHWQESGAYVRGLDLFNHGYYWEAHEVWEGLWHACGRMGPAADFLRGLIKLAAAGVKVREGTPAGVVSHAIRADAIFRNAAQRFGGDDGRFFGLRIGDLLAACAAAKALAPTIVGDTDTYVRVVFDFVLTPQANAEG